MNIERQVYLANIASIKDFIERGLEINDSTPPWLRNAVTFVRNNKNFVINEESLMALHRMGGTDHPDPTLHSSPTDPTIKMN